MQKPHPPIHLGAGGFGPNLRALKMTVAYGDGWAPIGLTPEQLATELARLRELCAEAGRDFAKTEISIYTEAGQGVPAHQVSDETARRMAREYEEAGAHRLIFLAHQPGNDFLKDLEQMVRLRSSRPAGGVIHPRNDRTYEREYVGDTTAGDAKTRDLWLPISHTQSIAPVEIFRGRVCQSHTFTAKFGVEARSSSRGRKVYKVTTLGCTVFLERS